MMTTPPVHLSIEDQNEPEEIVIDMRAEQKIPSKGCIIERFSRQRKVIRTATKKTAAGHSQNPN